jgi:carbohydrate-selective porin OprB
MKLQLLKSIRHVSLAAALAGALLIAAAAPADAASDKLVLTGFTDAAAGEQLMAGEYATVIEKLGPHAADFHANEVAASTNLCVAYVASGHLDEARHACNEAIMTARLEESDGSLSERLAHQDALSVAYANRAVLTKLSGQ